MHRILALALLTAGLALGQGAVYELRTYTAAEGKLEALKARFRDHTIAVFNKYGMESIGYWVPQDPERSKNTLIYLLKHPSREEAERHWEQFDADPDWLKAREESRVDGPLVLKVERVWLDPTAFSMLK